MRRRACIQKFLSLRQLAMGISIVMMFPSSALAILPSDRHAVIYNTTWYDPYAVDCATADTTSQSAGPTVLTGNDNPQKAYNFFISKGLTPVQAAAIVGNLVGESHVDPLAQEDRSKSPVPKNGVGFGIAQWTFTARQGPLMDFAKSHNLPVADLGLQLEFIWAELNGTVPGDKQRGLAELKAAGNDVGKATSNFMSAFEGCDPAKCHTIERILNADTLLKTNGAGVSGSSIIISATPNGGCSTAGTTSPGGGTTGGCANPFPDPFWKQSLSRTDDGVDYHPSKALPILAPCDLTILGVDTHAGWPGKGFSAHAPFIYAKFTSGPHAGKCWYVAENIIDLPAVGAKIPAGGKMATADANTSADAGIEVGFAKSQNLSAQSVGSGGYPGPSGRATAKFLRSLGAPTRDDPGVGAPDYAGGVCP